MYKTFILAGSIIHLISGCQSKTDNGKLIDYDKLNKVEIKLAIEIGESKEYVLGELGDLILASDRTMLVSDWGKTTIEQFSAEGEHLRRIAKDGRGPGELPSFFLLYKGRNDTLIVWHGGMSYRVDYFSKGTDNIYRFVKSGVRKNFKNRFVTIIGVRSDTGYYAKTRWKYNVLQKRIDNHPDFYWSPIVIVDDFDNILQDSLQMLKTPTPLVEQFATGEMMYLGVPPYQYQDHFRLMEDGRYIIARPDSSALYIYNRDHKLDQQIPLQVKERPVENVDLDYMFELINADHEVRKKNGRPGA